MRLIDADKLKETLVIVANKCGGSLDILDVSDAIEIAPSVERPHGEWIFHKYDKDYECSNCQVRFDRTQIYTEKRFENALWAKMEIYKFCPNCGADMREEGDEK